jgi:hypothetical protein
LVMKGFLLLLFLLTGANLYAQKISGIVVDKSTKLPVSGAAIGSSVSTTSSNSLGEFEILVSGTTDTLDVQREGYSRYSVPVIGAGAARMRIELTPSDILLNTVVISTKRNEKQDSINRRKAFEKEFNYRAPRLRDAFSGNSSFSPSAIFASINKKRNSEYKLRATLISDEREEYITRIFSGSLVSSVTGLKGDRLKRFLQLYRPDYGFVTALTTYDLVGYIKNCYTSFVLLEEQKAP